MTLLVTLSPGFAAKIFGKMNTQKISVPTAITPEQTPIEILAGVESAIDDSLTQTASVASTYQFVHVPWNGPRESPGTQDFVSEHQPHVRFPLAVRQFVQSVLEYFGHSSDGTKESADERKNKNILNFSSVQL